MNSLNTFLDPLYGECSLGDALENLLGRPVMQRLRGIRLSNIDSLAMPGIANIARYEHCVGTAVLAEQIGFRNQLSEFDSVIFQASALLHDSAIPPFGHLVEEAFEYVSAGVNHESRWSLIFGNSDAPEIGGIGLQIFLGRQAGLWPWAQATFKARAEVCLKEILETIRGQARFGKCICGDLDLDNLDNVTRAAFHMGLDVDKRLPQKIARAMVGIDPSDGVMFSVAAQDLIEEWLHVRRLVYGKFMLSKSDFIGKMMLIYATIQAYKRSEFTEHDWVLTDSAFTQKLLDSKHKEVAEPVSRWLCNEVWPLSDLVWMKGRGPAYTQVLKFSDVASNVLGRSCFAYSIRDKRSRAVRIMLDNGNVFEAGSRSNQWLLGVCSLLGKDFTGRENKALLEAACGFFSTEVIGTADACEPGESQTMSLFP